MRHPKFAIRFTSRSSLTVWLSVIVCAGSLGCRQRAFTEVYVENMANEIRQLEDLVYEYDAEYNSLENELQDLKRVNAELQSKLDASATEPRSSNSLFPKSRPKQSKNDSLLNLDSDASRPNNRMKMDDLEPPSVVVPRSNPQSPSTTNKVPPPASNDTDAKPSLTIPEQPSIVPVPESKDTASPAEPETELIPPPLNKPSLLQPRAESRLPRGLQNLSIHESGSQSRIDSPIQSEVQLASAIGPADRKSDSSLTRTPSDTRVREISFHPTMCRGHNFDGKPGDDGLYLVVVPKNSAGESINTLGTLTIVVEEKVAGEVNRVAWWEFTPQELEDLLEPIGVNQGFHLKLPWQDKQPNSTELEVCVRYTTQDGASPVGRKTIHLRQQNAAQSTWTPR